MPESLVLMGSEATYETVRAALPHYPIAHFSCHGISDRDNPAASRLLLHDYNENPLNVASISSIQLTNAELAFLSACSTSETNYNLTDEAVHITARI
jgi:CHAT domain-containing protein